MQERSPHAFRNTLSGQGFAVAELVERAAEWGGFLVAARIGSARRCSAVSPFVSRVRFAPRRSCCRKNPKEPARSWLPKPRLQISATCGAAGDPARLRHIDSHCRGVTLWLNLLNSWLSGRYSCSAGLLPWQFLQCGHLSTSARKVHRFPRLPLPSVSKSHTAYDNIPLVSFLLLRGRCRFAERASPGATRWLSCWLG